jgi:hypothetical protein
MNKKFLLGVAVVAVLVYFFSRSNENLPGGNISQDKVLDSSIIVTHEEDYGKMADRIVKLSDGMVVK